MTATSFEPEDTDSLDYDARNLLQVTLHDYDDHYGLGSMSVAVYDTAWTSLVTKTAQGRKEWLFPECFRFLLRTQLDDGSWESCASEVDGILNTAASLISLKRHAEEPLQMCAISPLELEGRIERATRALAAKLASWDVSAAAHVGFEIIVPALLEELERQGTTFNFKGHEELLKITSSKLSRFKPAYLYGKFKTTALHSLEAFIGKVDFDRVRHHKVCGAMMASPSSTAAYLMHSSTWDDEAESYLRHVVGRSSHDDEGGVPSAFPSTFFELSWILSTLLKSGYSAADLASPELKKAKDILAQCIEKEGGTIGFAPHVGSDADDTAKGILTLKLLGINKSPQRMVEEFEATDHFRTYCSERDPSLSANCNVLLALLHSDDISRYMPQILKCVEFICKCWWKNEGSIKDKWNLSYLYPSMLMVEALVSFLAMSEQGQVSGLLEQELGSRIWVSLCQASLRIMLQQQDNGSWNGSPEQTSYAILTLVQARRVAFFKPIITDLDSAIKRARAFLLSSPKHHPADHLWIEKVSYTSPLLSKAYILAALKISATQGLPTVGHEPATTTSQLNRLVAFYQRTPLFSRTPSWQLRASLLEASLFQPLLRARHLSIFPRDGLEAPRYLELIPFTWIGSSNRAQTFASASFLLEMMLVSMLNYQADEFMEAVAAPTFAGDLSGLRAHIERLFTNSRKRSFDAVDGVSCIGPPNGVGKGLGDNDELRPLSRFVAHTLAHPAVTAASAHDAALVQRELHTFLLGHVDQAEADARFQRTGCCNYRSPTHSFFGWVRGPSADHTSCPYSFALMCALLGNGSGSSDRADCFPAAAQKYFAAALCRHLATMCRLYNDAGSVARDRAEGTLNGLDFNEFAGECEEGAGKAALLELAQYEREGFESALERLRQEDAGGDEWQKKLAMVRLFCDVTDLYGQVYIVKDMGTRLGHGNGESCNGSG